jgi:transcriptional regulator with XRE-family HTH domain
VPFCHFRLVGRKPLDPAYPRHLHTLGDHLRKRRLDLGLPQREVAEMLGVAESTICGWEVGRTSPQLRFIPRIITFLGYDPLDEVSHETLGERIVATRQRLGMTQRQLARALGVDPTTVGRWERGAGKPSRSLKERLEEFLRSRDLFR